MIYRLTRAAYLSLSLTRLRKTLKEKAPLLSQEGRRAERGGVVPLGGHLRHTVAPVGKPGRSERPDLEGVGGSRCQRVEDDGFLHKGDRQRRPVAGRPVHDRRVAEFIARG